MPAFVRRQSTMRPGTSLYHQVFEPRHLSCSGKPFHLPAFFNGILAQVLNSRRAWLSRSYPGYLVFWEMKMLRAFFEQTVPVSDEVWDFFSSHLIKKELPPKTIILAQGQTEKYISFIEKGATRGFIPKEDNDITFAFVFENELLCAYDSFLTQTPCLYAIETLVATTLWRFSYDLLQKLYKEMPVTNILGRVATEQIYLNKAKRELSFLNDTAEERYVKLFTERPNLFTDIPLKYVASYIGVTPQALSRIRKRIS